MNFAARIRREIDDQTFALSVAAARSLHHNFYIPVETREEVEALIPGIRRAIAQILALLPDDPSAPPAGGWVVIDGRGKSCAGVIAALSRQMEQDGQFFVEAILADALSIYDVVLWAEQSGHRLLTQRKDPDRAVRVLIQP